MAPTRCVCTGDDCLPACSGGMCVSLVPGVSASGSRKGCLLLVLGVLHPLLLTLPPHPLSPHPQKEHGGKQEAVSSPPPWTEWQTGVKNITLSQTSFAGGKKWIHYQHTTITTISMWKVQLSVLLNKKLSSTPRFYVSEIITQSSLLLL